MIRLLARLWRFSRRALDPIIRGVQAVVLAISLFFVYFLGVGFSWLVIGIFQRRLIRPLSVDAQSFWEDVDGYDPDIEAARRQT